MLRYFARLLLCVISSLFSLQLFAAAPFTEQELATMRQYMYNNFATAENSFSKIQDGRTITSLPGAIIASPSIQHEGFSQDYQFHWTRDAGIAMRQVVKDYEHAIAQHQDASSLKIKLQNYLNFEGRAQRQFSFPGEETLGQPKFNIDGTVWEGMWARPQNDGPAIRALALCEMARKEKSFMSDAMPLIKTDLDYVAREWQHPGFDLWEEVNDTDHFFTKMMQMRALTCGGNLLYFVDHITSQRYTDTAKAIRASLDKHWNDKLGYVTETPGQLDFKGGGLNSAVLLAVLYGNELSEARYLPEWSVLDDRVMSTVAALRDTFAREYPVNAGNPYRMPLIGRYPNDKYDGNNFQQGNPWILATAAMAEYYYSLAYIYQQTHLPIKLTKRNMRFWAHLEIIIAPVGTVFEYGTTDYNLIMAALTAEGDYYLQTVKSYGTCESFACLHFAEQIDAKTGKPTSAKDLTWSYVSILRAMDVRAKL